MIVAIDELTIPFSYTNMANDLMPKLMDNLEHEEPAKVIAR